MKMNSIFNIFRISEPQQNINLDLSPNTDVDRLEKSERVRGAQSIVEDPLAIVSSLGYKDKPNSLTYDTLKRMSSRNSVVSSIVQTRVNQVSSFTQPARFTKDGVGFKISLRDPKQKPTEQQKRLILELESFIENCGYEYNPSRDDFDSFVRKILRDSLCYDQMTFEIVPDRLGRPAEIYAVDAATIRAATVDPREGEDYLYSSDMCNTEDTHWVQVVDGQVVAEFTGYELAFAVRNPRTDIQIQPYGFSELEILIHQITSHLWAEEYNSRYFSQGGTTKGILNLRGQNISKPQLNAFRRQWTSQLSGITGAWKTPVVSVDGLEYINVSQSNREMEYEMWMNYLINICCAVYQIDPAEINFPNRGGSGGGNGALGNGGIEDRLKNSKDKGLRPLLRFLESVINKYIIRRFTSDLSFNFVGLDPENETEKQNVMDKQIRTYKTVNEVRREHGYNPINGGEIILDSTYTNYLQQKQQNDMMGQQEEQTSEGNEQEGTVEGEQVVQWDTPESSPQQNLEEVEKQHEDDTISQSLDSSI